MILRTEPNGQGTGSDTASNPTRDAPSPLGDQPSRRIVRKPVDPSLARSNLAALEMAVLLIVAALAMVSIIVSAGCGNRQAPQVKSEPSSSLEQVSLTAFGGVRSVTKPADIIATDPSVPPQAAEKIQDDAKRNAPLADTADLSVGP